MHFGKRRRTFNASLRAVPPSSLSGLEKAIQKLGGAESAGSMPFGRGGRCPTDFFEHSSRNSRNKSILSDSKPRLSQAASCPDAPPRWKRRLRLYANVTSVHSVRTFLRPRRLKRRKPSVSLMMPNIGSMVCLRRAYRVCLKVCVWVTT